MAADIAETLVERSEHKAQLRSYFDGIGFDRWAAIYGDADLSRIRRTIRAGHEQMLAHAEAWLLESQKNGTLLDAGCGTGLFSTRMAQQGFAVTAIDIAPRMISATTDAARRAGVAEQMTFFTGDVEAVVSEMAPFDAVACFDVLVHYPQDSFQPFCTKLATLATGPLLITYAPHSPFLAALHKIGGFFPKGQRRTEIQMIPDDVVADALAQGGKKIHRTITISQGFYHVKLLEAR